MGWGVVGEEMLYDSMSTDPGARTKRNNPSEEHFKANNTEV